MRDAHGNLSLNDNHFDIFVNLLAETLKDLGVGPELT